MLITIGEARLRRVSSEHLEHERRRLRNAVYGLASAGLLTGVAVITQPYLFHVIFVFGALLCCFLTIFFGVGESDSIEAWEQAQAQVRETQRRWVESHGFKLTDSQFEELRFPLTSEEQERSFGTSTLTDESGKELTVTLEYTPMEGYRLRGASGLLQPKHIQEINHEQ